MPPNPSTPNDGDSTVLRTGTEKTDPDSIKTGRIPVLIVLEGPDKDLHHPVRKEETSIGRDAGADVTLDDSKASRFHSRILFTNLGASDQVPDCRLCDLDSTNGTFLNGVEVLDEEGVWLQDRDRIRVGDTLIGYFLLDEEAVPLV